MAGKDLLPLLENGRLVRREKRAQTMKKTFFASLRFKAIAEFLHRETTGRRKKGIPQGQAQAGRNLAGSVERDCS